MTGEAKKLSELRNQITVIAEDIHALYQEKREEYRELLLKKGTTTNTEALDKLEDELLDCEGQMLDYRSTSDDAFILKNELDMLLRNAKE